MTRHTPTASDIRGAILLLVAFFVLVFGGSLAYVLGVL